MNDPLEITEIFDKISYSKGGSILLMMINYLGVEQFQKGIHNYLSKYRYSNTVTNNLWEALEEGCNIKVKELMNMYLLYL